MSYQNQQLSSIKSNKHLPPRAPTSMNHFENKGQELKQQQQNYNGNFMQTKLMSHVSSETNLQKPQHRQQWSQIEDDNTRSNSEIGIRQKHSLPQGRDFQISKIMQGNLISQGKRFQKEQLPPQSQQFINSYEERQENYLKKLQSFTDSNFTQKDNKQNQSIQERLLNSLYQKPVNNTSAAAALSLGESLQRQMNKIKSLNQSPIMQDKIREIKTQPMNKNHEDLQQIKRIGTYSFQNAHPRFSESSGPTYKAGLPNSNLSNKIKSILEMKLLQKTIEQSQDGQVPFKIQQRIEEDKLYQVERKTKQQQMKQAIRDQFKKKLLSMAIFSYKCLVAKVDISKYVSMYCIRIYNDYVRQKEARQVFDKIDSDSSFEHHTSSNNNDSGRKYQLKRKMTKYTKKTKKEKDKHSSHEIQNNHTLKSVLANGNQAVILVQQEIDNEKYQKTNQNKIKTIFQNKSKKDFEQKIKDQQAQIFSKEDVQQQLKEALIKRQSIKFTRKKTWKPKDFEDEDDF